MTDSDQPTRRDPLVDIRDAAEALTDPYSHVEPRWEWDANRHRKPLPSHRVTLPGLIQQLRDMTEPGSGEEGAAAKSIPEPKPPVSLDAVSLLAVIHVGVGRRIIEYRILFRDQPRALVRLDGIGSVEDNIRDLVGVAQFLDYDNQRILASELRSWRNQAEVVCRWRNGALELVCPCPTQLDGCGARGTLLANPETEAVWCIACGREWAPEDSKPVFDHYRAHVEASRAKAAAVRGEVRARKAATRAAEAQARDQRSNGHAA